MDWIPIASVASTLVASLVTFYFGRSARELNSELSSIDEASEAELEEALTDAREGKLQPGEVLVRKEQASAQRDRKSDVTRQRDRSMAIAVVGAVAVVLSAVATPVATAYFSRPALACPEQIQKVIDIATSHPAAWVPLNADDDFEVACHLNEVAERVKGQGSASSFPSSAP